jgi:hypothetical protein
MIARSATRFQMETVKSTGFLCKLLHRLLTWGREKADLLNAVGFAYPRYGTQTAFIFGGGVLLVPAPRTTAAGRSCLCPIPRTGTSR